MRLLGQPAERPRGRTPSAAGRGPRTIRSTPDHARGVEPACGPRPGARRRTGAAGRRRPGDSPANRPVAHRRRRRRRACSGLDSWPSGDPPWRRRPRRSARRAGRATRRPGPRSPSPRPTAACTRRSACGSVTASLKSLASGIDGGEDVGPVELAEVAPRRSTWTDERLVEHRDQVAEQARARGWPRPARGRSSGGSPSAPARRSPRPGAGPPRRRRRPGPPTPRAGGSAGSRSAPGRSPSPASARASRRTNWRSPESHGLGDVEPLGGLATRPAATRSAKGGRPDQVRGATATPVSSKRAAIVSRRVEVLGRRPGPSSPWVRLAWGSASTSRTAQPPAGQRAAEVVDGRGLADAALLVQERDGTGHGGPSLGVNIRRESLRPWVSVIRREIGYRPDCCENML